MGGGGGGLLVKGLAILIFKFERAHSTLNVGHIANLSNDGPLKSSFKLKKSTGINAQVFSHTF